MPIATRVELVAAIEEVGEAVVVALERAGIMVEEYARGATGACRAPRRDLSGPPRRVVAGNLPDTV